MILAKRSNILNHETVEMSINCVKFLDGPCGHDSKTFRNLAATESSCIANCRWELSNDNAIQSLIEPQKLFLHLFKDFGAWICRKNGPPRSYLAHQLPNFREQFNLCGVALNLSSAVHLFPARLRVPPPTRQSQPGSSVRSL